MLNKNKFYFYDLSGKKTIIFTRMETSKAKENKNVSICLDDVKSTHFF